MASVVSAERRFLPDLLARADAARPAGMPPIDVAVTKWGPLGGHPDRLMVENFGAAAWGAKFLHLVLRNADRVPLASPNGLFHGGALRKAAGLLFTDPQVDVVQELGDAVGGHVVGVDVAGPASDVERACDSGAPEVDVPYVDGCAYRTADGRLVVSLASRDLTRAHEVEVALPEGLVGAGAAPGTDLELALLTADEVTDRTLPGRPDRFAVRRTRVAPDDDGVVRLTLPPFSVAWLRG